MAEVAATLFDIFLLWGCATAPDAAALSAAPLTPEIAEAVLQNPAIAAAREVTPGWLGLDLTKRQAWDLKGQLETHGARADMLETSYRSPCVSSESARQVAEEALEAEARTRFQVQTFETLQLVDGPKYYGHARWWVFLAVSPEWIEQGLIPGGLAFCVDRIDGHCWSLEDLELLSWECDTLVYLFPNWRDGVYGTPAWDLFQDRMRSKRT